MRYENIWENGGQPLADLALQQNAINFDLLHSHYQLSLVMQMLTKFGVKHQRPVNNLFDTQVIGLFFTDLQQKTQVFIYPLSPFVFTAVFFLGELVSVRFKNVCVTNAVAPQGHSGKHRNDNR